MVKLDQLITVKVRMTLEGNANGERVGEGFITKIMELYDKEYRPAKVVRLVDVTLVDDKGKSTTFLVG